MTTDPLTAVRERAIANHARIHSQSGTGTYTEGVDAVLALLVPAGWHMNKATWENELLYRIKEADE